MTVLYTYPFDSHTTVFIYKTIIKTAVLKYNQSFSITRLVFHFVEHNFYIQNFMYFKWRVSGLNNVL